MSLIQATPDTDEIIFDRKGAGGSVRVAVPLRDTILLANIFDRTKSFQSREKDVKDLSDEQILQKKKQLLLDHDKHSELDARAIGAGMVKTAGEGHAGNAFSGSAFEVDVDMLEPKTPEKEQGDDSAADPEGKSAEGKAEEEESKPEEKDAPKKRGFWDRDTGVASKMRAENNAVVTLQMQVENKLIEGRDQLKEASKRGADCMRETQVERETLTKRLEFLEAVMNPDSSALERLKQACSAPTATATVPQESTPVKGEAATATDTTIWAEQIGKAPPCSLSKVFEVCIWVLVSFQSISTSLFFGVYNFTTLSV